MITTIIAAHMGSKRLPGKTLMKINGKTCLEHVVAAAERLNPVVATYDHPINYPIVDLCEGKGISHFNYQGEAYDVLARFHSALEFHRPAARWVLRITPDCPMLTRDLVRKFVLRCEFRENTLYTNRPADNDGMDMELFPAEALKRAQEHATDVSEREHCTQWMYRHLNVVRFSILGNEVGHPEPEPKISIDTLEEYHFVRDLMERCYEFPFDEDRTSDIRARA